MPYPEVARQQRDVEESGTRQSVQDGNHCVKESQNECVASQISTDFAVPSRDLELVTVKDSCLSTTEVPVLSMRSPSVGPKRTTYLIIVPHNPN
jgi:hypothetical protein